MHATTHSKSIYSITTTRLGVVLNGEILAADHAVTLEPFAAELLGGTVGGVRPLDRHAVVVRVLGSELERVARDGNLQNWS